MNSDSSVCSEATADLIAAAMDLAKKKAMDTKEVRLTKKRNARERTSTEGSVATPKTKRIGGSTTKKKPSAAKSRQTKVSTPRKSVTPQKMVQCLSNNHGSSAVSNRNESKEGDSNGTETERSTQSCCSSSSLGELTDVSDDPMHLSPNSEPPSTNQILLEVARMYRQHAHLYLRQVAILEQTYPNRSNTVCSTTTEETETIVEMVKTMHEAVGEFQKLVKCVVEHSGGGDAHAAATENEETKKAHGTDHQQRMERKRIRNEERRQRQEWHAENDPWRAFEKDAVLQICEEDEFLRLHEQRTMTYDGVQRVQDYVKRRTLEMWGGMSLEEKEAYLEYTWGAGIDNGCDDSNYSVSNIDEKGSSSKRRAKKQRRRAQNKI